MKVEYKTAGVGNVVKGNGDGLISAYVMVTGIEDNVKDVIHEGAARESLEKRIPKGVWSHDWTRPISRTEGVTELPPGHPDLPEKLSNGQPWPAEAGAYKVDTLFNLATPEGNRAYQDVLFFGDQQEWSIGYKVPEDGYTIDKKTGVRHIHKLDWFEYSPVLFGAMSHARTKVSQAPSVAQAQLAHKALEGIDISGILAELKKWEREMGLNVAPVEYKGEGDDFEGDDLSDLEGKGDQAGFDAVADELEADGAVEDEEVDDMEYDDFEDMDEEEKSELLGLIRETTANLGVIEQKMGGMTTHTDDEDEDAYDDFGDDDEDDDDDDPDGLETDEDMDDYDDEDEDEDEGDDEDEDEGEDDIDEEEEQKILAVGSTAYFEAKAVQYDNVTDAIEQVDVPLSRTDAQALVAAAQAFDDAIKAEDKRAAEQAATEIMDILEVVVKSYSDAASTSAACVARCISDQLHRLEKESKEFTAPTPQSYVTDEGVEYKTFDFGDRLFGFPASDGKWVNGDEGARALIGTLDNEALVGAALFMEDAGIDDEIKEMVDDEIEHRIAYEDDEELKGLGRRLRHAVSREAREHRSYRRDERSMRRHMRRQVDKGEVRRRRRQSRRAAAIEATRNRQRKSFDEALETKRDFSPEQREKFAKTGVSLPDGSFPIPDEDALRRAIKSIGRAKNKEAARAHIVKRAKALGLTDLVPDGWDTKHEVIDMAEFKDLQAALDQFKQST